MYTKLILCLANSKKTSGRCVAGKEIGRRSIGPWVRPISRRPTHEISAIESRFRDGTNASVLDIVEIDLLRPVPLAHQSENHLIASRDWRKIGIATWENVQAAIDTVGGPLWLNGHSTNNGKNDKIPESELGTIADSLRLINVPRVQFYVAREAGYQGKAGKRKVRATFRLNGISYTLALTDPVAEARYLAKPDGTYRIGAATLCISLSEPMFGYAYKLLAAVLVKETS